MAKIFTNIGDGWREGKCLDCSAPILIGPDDPDWIDYVFPDRRSKGPLGVVCGRCKKLRQLVKPKKQTK